MSDIETIIKQQSVGAVVSLYPNMRATFNPFAFALNISHIPGDAIEIMPGCVVRRATTDEIALLREIFTQLFGSTFDGLWETRPPKSGSGRYVRLPSNKYRYCVIEGTSEGVDMESLRVALTIAPVDLDIGPMFLKSRVGRRSVPVCVYRPCSLFQSLSAMQNTCKSPDGIWRVVTGHGMEEARDIYNRLKGHDHAVFDLRRILTLYFDLKDLPHFSALRILGYFAILESLLTCPPSLQDPYSTITRQITQKLKLLNRRWNPSLDYTAFGSITHEKLWQKMYAYRSAIAHGREPDFGKELSALRTADDANTLLKQVVPRTICHALVEPELLSDLRSC